MTFLNIFRKGLGLSLISILVFSICIHSVNAITKQDGFSENLQKYLFTVAWVTDTQYLSKYYPDVLRDMVEWLNSEGRKGRIHYVVNTGDLVDDWNNVTQWRTFTSYWGNLTVENDVLAGNHDNYGGANWTYFDSYFPNRQYYYKLKNGWLFIFLSYSIVNNNVVQAWLRDLVKMHNEKIVVLTHAYISETSIILDGSYIRSVLNETATRNFTAWCGHFPLSRIEIVHRIEGNIVAILHDFQSYKNGGNGYLVLVDMYENGFYMHLYSVREDFDGRGKGKGYELSVVLFPPEQTSSLGSEDLPLMILILLSIFTVFVVIPRMRRVHAKEAQVRPNKSSATIGLVSVKGVS